MAPCHDEGTSITGPLRDDFTAPPQTVVAAHAKRDIFFRRLGLAVGALVCVLVGVYAVWYGSAGRFVVFPPAFNDFIDLGDSFLHRQLWLLEVPNPQLAALPNPYDFEQRNGLAYRWDASYYGGKYYLYWGPVPALVSAALERMLDALPSGGLLVTLPYLGLLAVLFALLVQISSSFFDSSSSLSIGLFVVVGFVNLPILFLLGQPRIYETSIIYGQFFLLAGLLAWVAYGRTEKPVWLALAGLNWGLAVACRYNLLISVVIFVTLALVTLAREAGRTRDWRKPGLLLAPIALCLITLGIYNALRFGDPLETGFSYQLTLPLPPNPYSISYAASNFYIYWLYPLTTADKFPFIKAALFDPGLLPAWLHLPAGRVFDHVIIGMLPSVPALWLIALGLPVVLSMGKETRHAPLLPRSPALNALPLMIGVAAAAQFLFVLVFFYGAERYLADTYLSLILIIAMLTWKTDENLRERPWLRFALWSAVLALTAWTAAIGFFGSFSIPPRLFRTSNPALYAQLASYWTDRFAWLQAVVAKAQAILSGSSIVP
jgi:hypothetical protein